ncbi:MULTISPECIES: TetR/AcrR family transcriptional regulator [Intestinimonas]|jgi:AcrR family transcriptional regulator|uniref:Transcriptional regulator, TetRNA family n=1 Tax=Intestinimonas butyriciproducens TaxID=1297617 RepID=A0A0S2W205_9FIRM|nr:TetR/AcrR family transcriptional regulator [Intestinimonas butyriciproducens]ALP93380.1 Transcriptional regulator, TetRNA family [Intestinimonas butyriciproducens]
MTKTRVPTQKRSIEKRQKIVKAGFDLFCEKGYYKTNTAEIAKYAGVSTGALYSYFEDKRQIFIEAFQQHLDAISSELLQQLISLPEVLELSTFIEKWIEGYINLYAKSNHALVQLRLVIVDDKEINHHFSALENTYFSNIADILKTRGIICADLFEKVYISCILIDSLRQEKTSFSHNGLDFEIIKKQVKQSIFQMLST